MRNIALVTIASFAMTATAQAEDVSESVAIAGQPVVFVDPSLEDFDRTPLLEWLQGVDRAPALAAALYGRAQSGEAYAQWRLAAMIDTGEIRGGTLEEAVGLFQRAAEQNYVDAWVSLGIMQARGRGTKRDYRAARANFERAARLGNIYAFYQIGVMHFRGEGVAQDFQESAAWFTVAAGLGHQSAQRSLRADFTDKIVDREAIAHRSEAIMREYEREP